MSPRLGLLRRRFRNSSLNNRSLGESVVTIFTCTIRGVFYFFVLCITLGIFLPLRLEA